MDRRHAWITGLILVLIIAINLSGLNDYPAPYCDEAAESAYGYSYIKYGDFSQAFLAREHGFTTVRPLLGFYYYSGLGIWLSLFGPTYIASRLHAVLGWLLLIGATFLVGKRAYNPLTGVLASLLVAVSLNMYQLSHINRPEMWVMAGAMLILYLTLVLEDQPAKWPYVLLGLAVVQLTTEVYISGVFYSAALGLLVVWRSFRPEPDLRKLAFFALGGLLGVAFFLALHVAFEPGGEIADVLFLANQHCTTCSTAATFSFASTLAEVIGSTIASLYILYVRDLNGLGLPFLVYALLGLGTAFHLRRDGDRTLLSIWGISACLFVVFPYKSYFYTMIWDPLLAVLAAAALTWLASAAVDLPLLKNRKHPTPATLSLLAASPLLIFNLGSQVWLTARFAPRDFQQYQQEVLRSIPPGSSVMADPVLWYAFVERNPFMSSWYWYAINLAETPTLDREIDAIMGELNLDYVVDDGTMGCTEASTPLTEAFSRYVAANCTRIQTIDDPYFGANGDQGQGQPTYIYDCRY